MTLYLVRALGYSADGESNYVFVSIHRSIDGARRSVVENRDHLDKPEIHTMTNYEEGQKEKAYLPFDNNGRWLGVYFTEEAARIISNSPELIHEVNIEK